MNISLPTPKFQYGQKVFVKNQEKKIQIKIIYGLMFDLEDEQFWYFFSDGFGVAESSLMLMEIEV